MKNRFLHTGYSHALFWSLTLFSASICPAQKIPSESPKATISQRVGLGDISVTYYRPGVKNRKIFGVLVPYGEVWRTGADYPTFIHLSDTTCFGESRQKVAPGKYALYTIPGMDSWTIILHADTSLWGAYGYKDSLDVLRFEVKPEQCPFTETFTIGFEEIGDDRAMLALQWEQTRVRFQLRVDVYDRVVQYLSDQIANGQTNWRTYWKGARFLYEQKRDADLALEWINRSLELDTVWFNLWTKAQILAWKGDYSGAVGYGLLALENGNRTENKPYFPYAEIYLKEIELWKSLE